ncbi:hypothetical protein N0V83_001830 [Neocucurbitaria cava]|uniref:GST N-terminal domain-containing protein n=1 Tax=Neocucurbitaria cava TaxID=798079 RepID=A0A9W9CQC4_9PLEO|nr:hypothetical protein N0V83_001830 [Neocucurbitaria cava]
MTTPKLHLYMTPGSCSLASHIALSESNLPFTTTDLGAKRGFPPAYLHLNPKGRVPILSLKNNNANNANDDEEEEEEEEEQLITETPAILSLISALAPEKHLLGTTPLEHARAHEWIAYLCGTLHGQAFGCLFRPGCFIPSSLSSSSPSSSAHLDAVRTRGREWVAECFTFIESKLSGAGAVCSRAGVHGRRCVFACFLAVGNACGIEDMRGGGRGMGGLWMGLLGGRG